MFKNLTLGVRIAGGFSLLILIALLLGGLAVFNMKRVESESTKLAFEFVPEVAAANGIERAALETMYAMRGYALSQETAYLKTGKEKIALVHEELDAAKDLAEKSPHLVKLSGQLTAIESALEKYATLTAETEAQFAVMDKDRAQLDASAAAYMGNSAEFLKTQNTTFLQELHERQEKISLVSRIVNLGTEARILNFKAQANTDPESLKAAIATLDQLPEITSALRPITRDAEDLKRIADTESAAAGYQQSMQAFLAEFQKGAAADPKQLDRSRADMDGHAAAYAENCAAFFCKAAGGARKRAGGTP